MPRPRLTEKAREDLQDIWRYALGTFGPEQAKRYLNGLREKLNLLAAIPGMAPPFSAEPTIRIGLYEKHRILYRETPQGIEIGRVLHQAQEFTRDLEDYARKLRHAKRSS
jgi:toxin ParE1/3/4